jgi:hypothetical protein
MRTMLSTVPPTPPDPTVPPTPADSSTPDPAASAAPMTDSSEAIARPAPRIRRLVVFTGRIP